MIERLPESARTPAVARAIMSPTGILAAGVGASVGILAGGGILGAVLFGVIAWGARVGVAVARRPKPERIEPLILGEPWRQLVMRAQSTANRFDEAVRRTSPGPLRERLKEVGEGVHTAVREGWNIAKRGDVLDGAVNDLDMAGLRRRLQEAQRTRAQDAIVQSLQNQLESAERLAGVADDAKSRLERLNAELEEAVARAVELSLSAADIGALQPLGSSVENVVTELEALRQALEETA